MELWRSQPASCSAFDSVFNELDEDIRRLQRKGSSNTVPKEPTKETRKSKHAVSKAKKFDNEEGTWVEKWIEVQTARLKGTSVKEKELIETKKSRNQENANPGRRMTRSQSAGIDRITESLANDLIDSCTLGECFRAHKESRKEVERISEQGNLADVKRYDVRKMRADCLNCKRSIGTSYYAAHLSNCLGFGKRSSSRTTSASQNAQKSPDDPRRLPSSLIKRHSNRMDTTESPGKSPYKKRNV